MTIDTRQLELAGVDPIVLRLRRFRRAKRLRYGQVAPFLGISTTQLARLELGWEPKAQGTRARTAGERHQQTLAKIAAYLERPRCPCCGGEFQ